MPSFQPGLRNFVMMLPSDFFQKPPANGPRGFPTSFAHLINQCGGGGNGRFYGATVYTNLGWPLEEFTLNSTHGTLPSTLAGQPVAGGLIPPIRLVGSGGGFWLKRTVNGTFCNWNGIQSRPKMVNNASGFVGVAVSAAAFISPLGNLAGAGQYRAPNVATGRFFWRRRWAAGRIWPFITHPKKKKQQ